MHSDPDLIFKCGKDDQYVGFTNDGRGEPAAAFAFTYDEIQILWSALNLGIRQKYVKDDIELIEQAKRLQDRLLAGREAIEVENQKTRDAVLAVDRRERRAKHG